MQSYFSRYQFLDDRDGCVDGCVWMAGRVGGRVGRFKCCRVQMLVVSSTGQFKVSVGSNAGWFKCWCTGGWLLTARATTKP